MLQDAIVQKADLKQSDVRRFLYLEKVLDIDFVRSCWKLVLVRGTSRSKSLKVREELRLVLIDSTFTNALRGKKQNG